MWKKSTSGREGGGIRIPAGTASSPDRGGGSREEDRIGLPVESPKKTAGKRVVFTAVFFVLLFAAMTAYFCHYAVKNRDELFHNAHNRRDELLEVHNRRGRIYGSANNGTVPVLLATSDVEEAREEGMYIGDTRDSIYNRYYPKGEQFSQVVGYSSFGGSGIEEYMKFDLLHSDVPFSSKLEYDRLGARYPGNDVYTTLDVNMQRYAWEALGDSRGAVIVTRPSNGNILAMVSKPEFDPNILYPWYWEDYARDNYVEMDPDQRAEEEWDALRLNTDGNSRLFNRVTQGLYQPGSTFKIVDSIELLEEDPSAMEDFTFDCTDGSYTYGGEEIKCFTNEETHQREVHGLMSLKAAFARSCNSAFAKIVSADLDLDRFRNTIRGLRFNQDLPYDLPYSRSSCSQMLEADSISDHNLLQVAIGQGETLVTPLHLNMITMAAANGGCLMRPHLVDRVLTAENQPVREFGPQEVKNGGGSFIDEETVKKLRGLMHGVTQVFMDEETGRTVWGTASEFDGVSSYIPFGKTGTAEFGSEDDTHAWFTGFALDAAKGEDEAADVCITVLVENGGVGSDKAVPIAKQILDNWFGE